MLTISQQISQWIRERVLEAGASGLILELDNNLGSWVVSALAKKSLGERVLGLIMPCCGGAIDQKYRYFLSKELQIRTKQVTLDPIFGPLLDTLLETHCTSDRAALTNLKPRLKMVILYYFAESFNYLVSGTRNKSEILLGRFTKYGDGAVDILPLAGLFKTEVKEVAREIGFTEDTMEEISKWKIHEGRVEAGQREIQDQKLDGAILGIESGNTDGLDSEILARVGRLIRESQNKRRPIPFYRGS
jgi:NAD+ synthase